MPLWPLRTRRRSALVDQPRGWVRTRATPWSGPGTGAAPFPPAPSECPGVVCSPRTPRWRLFIQRTDSHISGDCIGYRSTRNHPPVVPLVTMLLNWLQGPRWRGCGRDLGQRPARSALVPSDAGGSRGTPGAGGRCSGSQLRDVCPCPLALRGGGPATTPATLFYITSDLTQGPETRSRTVTAKASKAAKAAKAAGPRSGPRVLAPGRRRGPVRASGP